MALEIEATYENGTLKLDQPLPLREHERVTVAVTPIASRVKMTAGLIGWTGSQEAFEYLAHSLAKVKGAKVKGTGSYISH